MCKSIKILCSILVFLLFISAQYSFAQLSKQDKRKLRAANSLLAFENHDAALPIYLELLEKDSMNIEYNLAVGICYMNSKTYKAKALPYLQDAAMSEDTLYEVFYYLGQGYHIANAYDDAINSFELFKQFLGKDKISNKMRQDVDRRIEMCRNAKELSAVPVIHGIENIGPIINTKYPEYTPLISADESVLIFTSRREGSTGGLQLVSQRAFSNEMDYDEDIYVSRKVDGKWMPPVVGISDKINSTDHDACVGLSPDGKILIVYRSDSVRYGNLFYSDLIDGEWTALKKFPHPINTQYLESSATISADGKELYFSSNRPGGYGGNDIYKTTKLEDGSWSVPENLGPIVNTIYDEESPYFHSAKRTLYFSSIGHKSIGGFDIFKTTKKGTSWTMPKNIGFPVNTADDDFHFVLSANGKRGYLACKRPRDNFGEQDIYVIHFPQEYQKKVILGLLNGKVKVAGKPVEAKITAFDNENNQIYGTPSRSKPISGKYLLVLPAGRSFNVVIEADGYYFYLTNINFIEQGGFIKQQLNVDLQLSTSVSAGISNKSITFSGADKGLSEEDKSILNGVIETLYKNNTFKVEISGYVDENNLNDHKQITKDRCINILNYLIENGVVHQRVEAKGYGNSRLKNTIDIKFVNY